MLVRKKKMNQHISFGTTYNAQVNIERQGNEQHLT